MYNKGQRGRVVIASGCYPDSLGSASSNLAVVFLYFFLCIFGGSEWWDDEVIGI